MCVLFRGGDPGSSQLSSWRGAGDTDRVRLAEEVIALRESHAALAARATGLEREVAAARETAQAGSKTAAVAAEASARRIAELQERCRAAETTAAATHTT